MRLFNWIRKSKKENSKTHSVLTTKAEGEIEKIACAEVTNKPLTEPTYESNSLWKEYVMRAEKKKQMPIRQQLDLLQAETQECDAIIGKIYIQNPPNIENRYQLKKLLGNASLVEEYAIGGQGDNELHLIFAVNNLLIGIAYFAYWNSPFRMKDGCKVYRFNKSKSLKSLDFAKIKNALFF